jgi:formate-dependent nitrite reductase cytochrome c552 subunit
MQKQNRRKPQVIDATRAPFTTFGAGVVKGNPHKCITCHKPIKRGEAWRKHTSAPDPKFGRYSVIQHSRCEGGNG